MENKFNINDLELLIKSFKYCYFLEGDDKTHKRLDDSLELLKEIKKIVVKQTEPQDVYTLNYYVGGTPGDSYNFGVFTTYEKAKEKFNKVVNDYELKSEDNETLEDREGYLYWDNGGDFWGVLEIEKTELKK